MAAAAMSSSASPDVVGEQAYWWVNVDKQEYFKAGASFATATASADVHASVALLHATGAGLGANNDLRIVHPLIGSWIGDRTVLLGDYGTYNGHTAQDIDGDSAWKSIGTELERVRAVRSEYAARRDEIEQFLGSLFLQINGGRDGDDDVATTAEQAARGRIDVDLAQNVFLLDDQDIVRYTRRMYSERSGKVVVGKDDASIAAIFVHGSWQRYIEKTAQRGAAIAAPVSSPTVASALSPPQAARQQVGAVAAAAVAATTTATNIGAALPGARKQCAMCGARAKFQVAAPSVGGGGSAAAAKQRFVYCSHECHAQHYGKAVKASSLPTVTGIVATTPGFGVLKKIVLQFGLDAALDDAMRKFTVFAPDDAAFERAGITLDTDVSADVFRTTVLGHVVEGDAVRAGALLPPAVGGARTKTTTVRTLAGTELVLVGAADGTVVAGGRNVTRANVDARNGVIHIIDGVIGL